MYDILYQHILDGIFEESHAVSGADKADLIRSLRKPMRALWDSYRQTHVTVDYSSVEIQAAYLLRYYLPYSCFVQSTLSDTATHLTFGPVVNACLVGAGPAPEALGLATYFDKKSKSGKTQLVTTLADRTSNQWRFSRNVTFNRLIPAAAPATLSALAEEEIDVSKGETCRGEYDLVLFQNCLNEIVKPAGFDYAMLRAWTRLVRPNGSLVFIDRSGYDNVVTFLGDAENGLAGEGFEPVLPLQTLTYDARGIYDSLPTMVKDSLLYYAKGSLINRNSENDRLILQNHIPYLRAVFKRPTRG